MQPFVRPRLWPSTPQMTERDHGLYVSNLDHSCRLFIAAGEPFRSVVGVRHPLSCGDGVVGGGPGDRECGGCGRSRWSEPGGS